MVSLTLKPAFSDVNDLTASIRYNLSGPQSQTVVTKRKILSLEKSIPSSSGSLDTSQTGLFWLFAENKKVPKNL
jgi:hypothetical protein